MRKKIEQASDLVEIAKVWGPAEAEVVKSFLESEGISCILKGLVVQSVHPFSVDGLGEIRIFVARQNEDLAKKLIQIEKRKKTDKKDQPD
ncbi:MAG: putative signal transducing protein [Acidobacteriota bacterium]